MPKEWHFVSSRCNGETCCCGAQATHKVGEEIPHDDPHKQRHNFTAYVCCACFRRIMGDAVFCPEPFKDLYGQTPAELFAEFAEFAEKASGEPEPPGESDAQLNWNGDLR